MKIRDIVPVALGKQKADVLIKNGKIVNVFTGRVEEGNIALFRKRIAGIGDYTEGREVIDVKGGYVVPGFIDAHLHIESSMVAPREFARAVLPKGTTTVIADPHEITNVLGLAGLEYMIHSTEGIPLNVYIALPSAVPATTFETSGARLGPEDMVSTVDKYPRRIIALGEVMNFPGVLNVDNELITKIEILRHEYKKIDGHAPGLTGKELNAYITGFIRSDHECTSAEEALEKVGRGMQVLVREGTAAKNLEAIVKKVNMANHSFFSFCTDDREPIDIINEGHIDFLIRKAIALGLDPIIALRMATVNTTRHYNLRSMGAIAPGYKADLVVVGDLELFDIKMVIKDSHVVAEKGEVAAPVTGLHWDLPEQLGGVKLGEYGLDTFRIPVPEELRTAGGSHPPRIRVIGMKEGDLYTDSLEEGATVRDGYATADPKRNLAKVVVFDRYRGEKVARAFAQGFGVVRGAVATTIGHDSHNLSVMGMSDDDMYAAVRRVRELNGGIVVVIDGKVEAELPLPIAGLMSNAALDTVVEELGGIKRAIRKMGTEKDILMPLHFIQLAVIPELKLTDYGLVDIGRQEILDLWV
ncbi:MAG: adenine deaminase [Spirochaetia bacterium]